MAIEFHKPVIKFLSSIPTLLCIFILCRAYSLIYSILYPPKYANLIYYMVFIIGLALYCLLSYLVLKRNKISIYIMICILTLNGLWSVILGFAVAISQYILKTYGIVFGLYWLYGVFILYSYVKSFAGKKVIDHSEA